MTTKYDLEVIVFNSLLKVIEGVPFIDGDTYTALLDRKFPIIVSLGYDDFGIVIHEDRVEFADEYTANDEYLASEVIDKLMDKPVLQSDKVFTINGKYYQLQQVEGDIIVATLFATFNLEEGFAFYWKVDHRIKVEDLTIKDAKKLGLI